MRRVAMLAFEDVQVLDVTAPLEVFSLATRLAGGSYALELVASGPIVTSSGLHLQPHRSLGERLGSLDTLIVAGGRGVHAAAADDDLIDWVRAAAAGARRVASVCTGAFLLARAGLLDGRRATTHWAECDRLAADYPEVEVDPQPIFVRDGHVYTSAGVTAGIDLALALVEEDLGGHASQVVARQLVVYMRRPGAQAQMSAGLAGQACAVPLLRELQDWIAEHLDADLSVPALAERAFMSPRHFARVFKQEVGATPGSYVEAVRVERARTLLATTDLQLAEIARRCGFGTVETLRRTFGRHTQRSPAEYRRETAVAPVIPITRSTAA
ncbi:MAG TPA: GlxA family transcriptional regulator [Solirubrobacteraceae bacterium]|nr:GlxA family transcriptional regulator [Solirubrobacteraceae bacterium]